MGDQGYGISPPTIEKIAAEVKSVHDVGVQICMVIGGGNIFRGLQGSAQGMERTTADYMGMLATVMNALAMQSALEGQGVYTRVISAIPMDQICEPYIRRRAVRHLEKNRVCIFTAGTGNPYFTTDTAAALRASEMACNAVFMGKQVDGIYDSDPKTNSKAKRYKNISYNKVLQTDLKVMDASAIALMRDNKMPLIVFSLDEPGGFKGILNGEGTYTKVTEQFIGTQQCSEQGKVKQMGDEFIIDTDDLQRRMDGALSAMKGELASLRTGRATSSMLDPITLEVYGQRTPLNQLGTINVPEPRMVTINVWDKTNVPLIEKAIRESGLGINPQLNGAIIMLPIPELNEERRRDLSRVAGQYAESARVAVRNIRRDGMDQIKKAKADGMSEDDQKFWEEAVQELTDSTIKMLDGILDSKQAEIMQV